MINEKDKKIIDDFLKKQNFNFDEYDDFIEYVQARGMINKKAPNLKLMYDEFNNPIKRTSKFLKLTYKELSDLTGYTEGAFKNAISRNDISEPMKKSLFLLLEIHKLKERQHLRDEALKKLKTYMQDFINNNK